MAPDRASGRWAWLAPGLLLCLLGRAPAAEAPAERPPVVGPRITLAAADQPLEAILTDLARQLNGRLAGSLTDRLPSLRELRSLHLEQATLPDLPAALLEATGATLTRAGRNLWLLGLGQPPPPAPLVRPLADGRLRLDSLRLTWDRTLWPANPAAERVVASLTPGCSWQGLDDVVGLRLLGLAGVEATTDEGQRLTRRSSGRQPAMPQRTDPSILALAPALQAPALTAQRLTSLWLDLRFASRLQATGFEFGDLTGTTPQERKSGGVKVTLAAPRPGDPPGTRALTVTQSVPGFLDPKEDLAVLRRDGWLSARFSDAEGQPLLTAVRLLSVDPVGLESRRWVSQWQIAVLNEPWLGRLPAAATDPASGTDPAAGPAPAALAVVCYRPAGKVVVERVTFEDLPLPPREGDGVW